ncbi:PREDICTED: DNA-3-methyladenine glycosylase [Nicotiana attenuata]|uniref:DNA-3-methyladenine glycosylase II n=1 Tax=Nicotiana attenuata TaxID=49451 RepID=A0A1J6HZI0_NICAT|nr:PREDICTED: DNA-3-methyladenine glycosylase [Nicotiana attenuata]OIS97737.1 dna-3-methyladenine glycosylase [Nicotiana attenuata]
MLWFSSKLPARLPFLSPVSNINPMKKPHCLKNDRNHEITVQKLTTKTKASSSRATIIKVKNKPKSKDSKPNSESQENLPIPQINTTLIAFLNKNPILTQDFYQIDALDLAPRLLGKFLRRDDVVLQITEVEAYRPNDSACHGRFGKTARTAPVFGPGGHAYVYLCYGLHMMLNVVADKEGVGAAVLIRSCAPISGLGTIQQRRGLETEKPILLAGPGKVGQALGLSTEWSSHALYTAGGLELLDGPEPDEILVGPRVGIEYALPEHANALWRFAVAGSSWISAPKKTLRPL